tara:strand:- start:10881 stop:11252 length:372 start_codon:yes stop_codon:yes gene_type:complete
MELKATDLRINNLVYELGEDKEVIIIGSIEAGDFRFYVTNHKDEQIGSDFLLPIPLTEEWLLRFDISDDYFYHIDDGLLVFGIQVFPDNYYNTVLAELKYVHQLQNLYFALTGEELEYTPTKK